MKPARFFRRGIPPTGAVLVLGFLGIVFPVFANMEEASRISLSERSLVLEQNEEGMNLWKPLDRLRVYDPGKVALLICDMWDKHWSHGATVRVAEMAPKLNQLASRLREAGVLIIHSPSDTMDFYADSPARKRALDVRRVSAQVLRTIQLPPLPIDDSDGGSDTNEKPWYKAWTRQHPAIVIDEERDIISADGEEIYSYLHKHEIRTVFYTGVHTNMCVLKSRSFSLKPMAEMGIRVRLVRDLTDTMYNPARAPYVSHDEGTRLVIRYIEKFLCPTVSSADFFEDEE
ncbi:MAG: isochorismatase family protein [Acidobacteriota bacterium]|nr:MAG: isochorismatase family protein [Acidobacteriota bacterium]